MDSKREKSTTDDSAPPGLTRKDIFVLLKNNLKSGAAAAYLQIEKFMSEKLQRPFTLSDDVKSAVRILLYRFIEKWKQVSRHEDKFFEKFSTWLSVFVPLEEIEEASTESSKSNMGRPSSGLADANTEFFETKQEPLEPVSPGDITIKDEFVDSGAAVTTPHEELEQLLATAECSTALRPKRLRTDEGDHWQADDPKLSAVLEILKKLSDRDDSGVYGEHVAMKIRSYSTKTKSMVQHLINNVLFDADMGKFDNPFPAE